MKLGHMKPRNNLANRGKLLLGKKDQFSAATAISKRITANQGIKISRRTISRRISEFNLNSPVASTMPYISQNNKMTDRNLLLNTSHGLKKRGIVLISMIN